MNLFVRFGNWLDQRRVLRQPDLEEIKDNVLKLSVGVEELFNRLKENVEMNKKSSDLEMVKVGADLKLVVVGLQALNKKLEENKIPDALAKEWASIKIRLDRLELLTGLKREPAAVPVNGAARIE